MKAMLVRAAAAVLDWVAPRECLGCNAGLSGDGEWCDRCVELLEPNHESAFGDLVLLAPFRHIGPIRDSIHRLKYAGRSEFARRLIAAGFGERPSAVGSDALLVPVPLHPQRLVERGYNQSALLAAALARRWRLPLVAHAVRRSIATKPQVGQNREQRAHNMRCAFAAWSPPQRGALWLVDDVVTTGATISSCRRALEAAGSRVEGIIALVHANTSRNS